MLLSRTGRGVQAAADPAWLARRLRVGGARSQDPNPAENHQGSQVRISLNRVLNFKGFQGLRFVASDS